MIVIASGKLFMCGDGKYGKLCADVNQFTVPTLVTSFVDRNLNVQMVRTYTIGESDITKTFTNDKHASV